MMRTKPMFKRKKGILIASLVTLLALGGTVYKLADRYLIEHVELVVSDPDPAVSTSSVGNSASTTGTISTSSSASGSATAAAAAVQSDDWNLQE